MVRKNKASRDILLGVLQDLQQREGCVSASAVEAVAAEMGLPVAEVYGVATFYSFLSPQPLGRHVIRVCQSGPCHLAGAQPVAAWIGEALGIAPGQTTADGRFSLEMVNCIGACDQAPAMLIDDTVYGGLTADKVAQILRSLD